MCRRRQVDDSKNNVAHATRFAISVFRRHSPSRDRDVQYFRFDDDDLMFLCRNLVLTARRTNGENSMTLLLRSTHASSGKTKSDGFRGHVWSPAGGPCTHARHRRRQRLGTAAGTARPGPNCIESVNIGPETKITGIPTLRLVGP